MKIVISELNSNDGKFTKIRRDVNIEVEKNLSNIRSLLELALFFVIQSVRYNPDKFYLLLYTEYPTQIQVDNNLSCDSRLESKESSDIIEVCKNKILDLAKRFYTFILERMISEVINESNATDSTITT